MDRRRFIKNCSLIAGGLAARAGLASTHRHSSALEAQRSLSLYAVTDKPERSLTELESILRNSEWGGQQLKFREFSLLGPHMSDFVLVQDQHLVDYRSSEDDLARNLQQLAKDLGFPRNVANPQCVEFSTRDSGTQAEHVRVYNDNVLLEQLPIHEDLEAFKVEGVKGGVTLAVRNRSVKIVAATCKHKTCAKMGTINAPGQSLVCIPSALRITIEGQHEGIDSLAY